MSYVKRSRQGPEVGVGGFSSSESMYGGKKRSRKTKARKQGGKTGLAGMGIRAKGPGMMRKGSGHKF